MHARRDPALHAFYSRRLHAIVRGLVYAFLAGKNCMQSCRRSAGRTDQGKSKRPRLMEAPRALLNWQPDFTGVSLGRQRMAVRQLTPMGGCGRDPQSQPA
jgi:hypothetical protein